MTSKVLEMKGGPMAETTHLPEAAGRRLTALAGAIAAIGVVLSVIAVIVDHHRFAFSYLTGFAFTVTLALGALFFIIVTHVTKAGWSVVARRHMEWVAVTLPVAIVLFIPVALLGSDLYWEWWPGSEGAAGFSASKASWLSPGFFFLRAAVYLIAWSLLGWWFHKKSREQDETGDPRLTVGMQRFSAPMLLVFAATITFAGFDWLMSLQPHWYSTIFGVYVFAGAFVNAMALLGLITVAMQRRGYFKRISTVEHRHDIGKLMFAFTVFWGYIAFSQFFLIWYANLPEETIFYFVRWHEGWKTVSLLLIFTQFAFPFLFFISRHPKRSFAGMTLCAVVMLVGHYVDMYFLVMPMEGHHAAFHASWIDLAGLLGPAGVFFFFVARRAAREPIYPLRDPRIAETTHVENL